MDEGAEESHEGNSGWVHRVSSLNFFKLYLDSFDSR